MADIGDFILGELTDEIRLADQLEQITNLCRQSSLVLSQTCTVSGQARHGRGSQRRHTLFGSARFHQLCELLKAVLGQRNFFIEVHQHAKHFLKVRIQVLQGVIELT